MTEAIYDDEIAPELARLATLCHKHGMAFTASVEYEHGQIGTTTGTIEPQCVQQFIASAAVNCRGNFDSLAIAVCKKYDTSASIVLSQFNNKG